MRMQSQIGTVMRGSVGGLTFTAGRNHAIICRSRVGPARLSTNRSALVRTCLQATQAEWKALSEADRILWDQYALTVTFSGPLGNYTITGQQMFVRTLSITFYYQMLGLIGFPFPIVTTPPSILGFLLALELALVSSSTTFLVTMPRHLFECEFHGLAPEEKARTSGTPPRIRRLLLLLELILWSKFPVLSRICTISFLFEWYWTIHPTDWILNMSSVFRQ